jgi:quercetin dioxygenase-like cupin family protein
MSREGTAPSGKKAREAVRAHQPEQADFRAILPGEIEWKPFPAFPPSARLAIVVGEPNEDGPYTIRVKLPNGTKMMPHSHPEDRMYTVICGIFYIGLERVRYENAKGVLY